MPAPFIPQSTGCRWETLSLISLLNPFCSLWHQKLPWTRDTLLLLELQKWCWCSCQLKWSHQKCYSIRKVEEAEVFVSFGNGHASATYHAKQSIVVESICFPWHPSSPTTFFAFLCARSHSSSTADLFGYLRLRHAGPIATNFVRFLCSVAIQVDPNTCHLSSTPTRSNATSAHKKGAKHKVNKSLL